MTSVKAVDEAPIDQATFSITVGPKPMVGIHVFRLSSPAGISGPLPFYIHSEPVIKETGSPHAKAANAQPVNLPIVVDGIIAKPGEFDFYSFLGRKGQRIQVEILTGAGLFPGSLEGFRSPELVAFSPAKSWFNTGEQKWLEGVDHSICFPFPKTSQDTCCLARYTYQFQDSGLHFARVARIKTGGRVQL